MVTVRVVAEHPDLAPVTASQTLDALDRGGLAGAVRARGSRRSRPPRPRRTRRPRRRWRRSVLRRFLMSRMLMGPRLPCVDVVAMLRSAILAAAPVDERHQPDGGSPAAKAPSILLRRGRGRCRRRWAGRSGGRGLAAHARHTGDDHRAGRADRGAVAWAVRPPASAHDPMAFAPAGVPHTARVRPVGRARPVRRVPRAVCRPPWARSATWRASLVDRTLGRRMARGHNGGRLRRARGRRRDRILTRAVPPSVGRLLRRSTRARLLLPKPRAIPWPRCARRGSRQQRHRDCR